MSSVNLTNALTFYDYHIVTTRFVVLLIHNILVTFQKSFILNFEFMNRLLFAVLLGLTQLFYSCKKFDNHLIKDEKKPDKKNVVSILKNHLTTSSLFTKTKGRFTPDVLLEKLDFENIKITDKGNNKIVIANFKKTVISEYQTNSNENLDSVVLFGFNADTVINYYIVNYTGDSITENNAFNFYTLNIIDENGSYRYYNSNSKFMSTLDFENGKLKSIGVFRKKINRSFDLKNESCIDWYIVTTFYDSGGNITAQYETYIGTTCDGNCTPSDPYLESLECASGGSGGGSGENPPSDPNAPGDKLCNTSFQFKAGTQDSFWETNMRGLRFENGQTTNDFDAYFFLANGILDANFRTTSPNSALGISAYQALQEIPMLSGLLGTHIHSQVSPSDGKIYWYFDHYAVQTISSWASNFASATVILEVPGAANPANMIARTEWRNRTEALLKAVVPGSRVSFNTNSTTQNSIAWYGTNCN